MSKETTKPVEEEKPIELPEEITERLMQEAHLALCKLSTHYKHLDSIKQYEVNKCIHILWKL